MDKTAAPDPEALLFTERLRLEPIRVAHAAELIPLLSDARLYAFIPQDPPADVAALERRYARLERRASDDGTQRWLNWALRATDLAGEPLIGTAQATVLADQRALIAYDLGHAHQGRGYATEACSRVLALLFHGYAVQRVIAECDTLNAPSIRLLERLGFVRTGVTKDADHFKGRTSDEYRYVLDRPAC
ncbi:GNAT family N-acetyltransferase [Aquabacterium humicola]|uniref:GNAT family N-acetyltransferase n=1 Tax=Aquabacterium humicola TaxID=3237377 RepID=UPI00254367A5|nr:GNAT family protein [Rubrivivax pictus]